MKLGGLYKEQDSAEHRPDKTGTAGSLRDEEGKILFRMRYYG